MPTRIAIAGGRAEARRALAASLAPELARLTGRPVLPPDAAEAAAIAPAASAEAGLRLLLVDGVLPPDADHTLLLPPEAGTLPGPAPGTDPAAALQAAWARDDALRTALLLGGARWSALTGQDAAAWQASALDALAPWLARRGGMSATEGLFSRLEARGAALPYGRGGWRWACDCDLPDCEHLLRGRA